MSEVLPPPMQTEVAPKPDLWGAIGNTLQVQSHAPSLAKAERTGPLPLSSAQQRLWFLQQADPSAISYNLPFAWRISGPLNVTALEQGIQAIVRRHENFRTTFIDRNGHPAQVIAAASNVLLKVIDLQSSGATQLHPQLHQLVRTPFDLSRGPLLCPYVLRLGPEDHVLLLVMHHIVCDGSSLQPLFDELQTFYHAYNTGATPALPDLPLQYADFAIWQRSWLNDGALAEQWAFWKKQLAGKLPVLELPSDRTRPSFQTFQGAHHFFQWPQHLSKAVQHFKKQQRTTVFNVLLAAFNALLYRYTGQEDMVVGVPTANRNRSELWPLIGFFVNTLVLRTQVSGDISFRQLLDRIKQVSLEAFANQDLPFDRLVEELKPERALSHTPLFQVMLSFQSLPRRPLDLPGVHVQMLDLETGTSKFDLTFDVNETARGLAGYLEYNTDIFEEATIRRMSGHLQNLLVAALQNPDQPLSSLPIMTQAERRQVLVGWNSHTAPFPEDVCLHQLIEAQAALTPQAVALVDGERRLTYTELNARANQLAHFLRKLGIGPDVLAGVCLERSAEMVIGMMAILKAGGAYVPLDPAYPKDRLRYTFEDAKAPVLLTQSRLLNDGVAELAPHASLSATGPASDTAPASGKPHVICLDTDWAKIACESTENLSGAERPAVAPSHLAYVLYTSGSTGRPKGVAIEHRSAVAFAYWAKETFSPEDFSGVLFATSICFDLSVFELFVTLSWGGKVVLAENALALPELPAKDEVTLVNTVPSAMAELVRLDALPKSVHTVNLAGEPLAVELVNQIYRRPHIMAVYDLYGPTEDTTYSTFTLRKPGQPATIGRPLVNEQVYILDPHGQPTPVGVPGELHIGGVGLARGYLNRPELTAEKFIPNPFSAQPGARMYRTGDLARFRPDGQIEYLGRIDFQVKIRGFRIELGEIEAVLRQHNNVQEVVVVANQAPTGEKRLAAYVAAKQDPAPEVAELRNFIKQKLPDYMVPAVFIFLQALPLTPNGKVDRKALPAPDQSRPDLGKTFVAPQTPVEKTLAQIWSQALRLEQIGAQDNFFELGGDSILSIQIISRANQAGLRLTPKQLFQNQTIAELARVAEVTAAPAIEQGLVSGAVPLTPIQQWFFAQNFADAHHWNQAVMLDVQGEFQPEWLEKALPALVLQHDALRLRFGQTAEGWQQQHSEPADSVSCEQFDMSGLPPAEQEAALKKAAAQAHASLNFSTGPMIKAILFHLGPQSDRLLLVIHHLVVDGVSWRILIEDLETACRQISQGQAIRLPNKSTSFKQWAERLVEYAQTPALEKELEYWQRLKSTPANLPLDFPAAANTEESARTVSVSLSVEETCGLLQRVAQAYNTQINDVLLAALGRALAEWTGEKSVLVHLEGHGREDLFQDVDLSRTVGWFTTLFPVRLDVGELPPGGDLLKSIKEQLRAIPNRGLGFGLLRYLNRNEQLAAQVSELPAAQIVFNYLGQFDQGGDSIFRLRREVPEPLHSPKASRAHVLEINGSIIGGRLQLDWGYSANLHRPETVERLARIFSEHLRALIAHCANPANKGRTPSDFPLARLTQPAVDALLAKYPGLEDIYPLSPMQKLFHTLASGGSEIGFEQFRFTLEGKLHPPALAQAWQQLLNRHSILRTAFAADGLEEPLQVVCRDLSVSIAEHDWRQLSPEAQQEEMQKFLRADREQGFDLSKPPLMRLHLVRTADEHYEFVWSFHHILLDGWSWPLVLEEIAKLYEPGRSEDSAASLPATRPYREYIAWLQKQDLAQAQQFWTEALKGFTTPTPLPGAKRAPELGLHQPQFKEEELRLSPETTSALQSWGRTQQLTLSSLIEAAWALVLSRGSGREDVLFGSAVSGRSPEIAGVESMIGLFINNLPRRVHVNPDEKLTPWLKALQEKEVEAGSYEYTPLVQIQKWGQVPLRLRLFDSLVLFQNYQVDSAALSQLGPQAKITQLNAAVHTSYPITLMAVPEKALLLKIIYDGQLFDPETIAGYLKNLHLMLQTMAGKAEFQLSELLERLPKPTSIPQELNSPPITAAARNIVPPSDDIQVQLTRIWERVLGIQPIGVTENFFDLGGHSLPAVSLFQEIKNLYGRSLPMVTLFQAPTIEKLARVLRQDGWEAPWQSLVPIKATGGNPPFYCVHGVGGNILEYLDLAKYTHPDQPFYGLQAVGLDGKRPWLKTVKEMAAHYISEIKTLQPEGPYYIGGSSFGGLVAYEMAQQLRSNGEKISLLALFDTHAPGYPKEMPALPLWQRVYNYWSHRIGLHWGNLMAASGKERWDYIWSKAQKWRKGRIIMFHRRLRRLKQRLFMPREIRQTRNSAIRALYAYTPAPYPGRAALFRATEQPKGIYPDPELGWGTLVQGGLDIYNTPGHHGAIVRDPRARILAEQLQDCLAKARNNGH